MKKIGLNAIAIALLLGLSTPAIISCSKEESPAEQVDESTTEVVFEDASLAGFIKDQLGLSSSAKITRGDLVKLTKLSIRSVLSDVTSLKGLEYATELTELDFGGNKVADLMPIKDLKKMTYLRMNESAVTDLGPLSEYTTLTYFNANQAGGITTLAPLAKNTGLQTMILRGNPLGNSGIAALANFTKLYRLNIRSTGVTDLTVIAELMGKGAFLKTTPGAADLGSDPTLDLQDLQITNCNLLDQYRENLAGAVEGACAPSTVDPDPEPGADDAVEVPFTNNQNVADIIRGMLQKEAGYAITRGDLRGLTGTLDLKAIKGDLTTLEGLEYTTQLTQFNANGNDIGADRSKLTSLAPLKNNANLNRIIARLQPLDNAGIAVISNFKKLDRMNIRDTKVTSLAAIAALMDAGAPLLTLDLTGLTLTDCVSLDWTAKYATKITIEYKAPANCN